MTTLTSQNAELSRSAAIAGTSQLGSINAGPKGSICGSPVEAPHVFGGIKSG